MIWLGWFIKNKCFEEHPIRENHRAKAVIYTRAIPFSPEFHYTAIGPTPTLTTFTTITYKVVLFF